jgi:hypothetical protein
LKQHPKHVEQFPDINKLRNVASCWIYIGILLGAHPIHHISRIRVKLAQKFFLLESAHYARVVQELYGLNVLLMVESSFVLLGKSLEVYIGMVLELI